MKSLKFKLGAIVGILVFIALVITVTIFINNTRKLAFENAKIEVVSNAKNSAISISNKINMTTQEINLTIQKLNDLKNNEGVSREELVQMFEPQILRDSNFIAVYANWESNKFDGRDNQYRGAPGFFTDGRFGVYWYFEEDSLILDDPDYEWQEYLGEFGEWYEVPQKTKKTQIFIDLYPLPKTKKEILMLSVIVPVIENGEFVGLTGVDIKSEFMQIQALNLKEQLYNGEAAIEILTDNGEIAANSRHDTLIGNTIENIYPKNYKKIQESILLGESNFTLVNDTLYYSSPIKFMQYDNAWQLNIAIPYSVIMKDANTQLKKQLLISFIILLLSISIIIFFLNKMIKPLFDLTNATKKIADGNLNVKIEVKGKDEIGQLSISLNTMVVKIKEIIQGINNAANNISDGSTEVAEISQHVSQNANEQASTTEEISTSMEEMVVTIDSNTQRAIDTGQITENSANEMQQSNEIFMNTLKSVSEISGKIAIISEIADKTDILSINAAIEAARAGESGKGFAVVANEIRKLADKTKLASDEINELSINGQEISNIAGEKLKNTILEIIKSAKFVGNIVTASKEQQKGVEAINNSLQQLTEITNQNSASSEQMSASAEQLTAQAEQLKTLISIFQFDDV